MPIMHTDYICSSDRQQDLEQIYKDCKGFGFDHDITIKVMIRNRYTEEEIRRLLPIDIKRINKFIEEN